MVAGRLLIHADQSRACGHALLAFDQTNKRSVVIILSCSLNCERSMPSSGRSIIPQTGTRTCLLSQIKRRDKFSIALQIKVPHPLNQSDLGKACSLASYGILDILWRPLWDTSHCASHSGNQVLGTSAGKITIISPL